MKYINSNNGRIIDVTSKMGGAWAPLEAPVKPKAEEPKKTTAKKGSTKK